MFERSVEWTRVVGIISDIAKGTSTVSLRQYSKSHNADDTSSPLVFGWDFHRVQPHGLDTQNHPALVSDSHLKDVLSHLMNETDEVYVYEVEGSATFDVEANSLLREFSAITVTTVKLSVGVVDLGWFMVKLASNRDIVHWKMRYHERDVSPGTPSAV